jgi:hypothetical protein
VRADGAGRRVRVRIAGTWYGSADLVGDFLVRGRV